MINSERIFIAIDISKTISHLIPMLKTTMDSNESNFRWISGKNLHLTLSFLGNIDSLKIKSLISELDVISQFPMFKISLNGTGVFPKSDCAKILWLGVDEGYDELSDIQAIIDEISYPFKASKRQERFIPHVTIGRLEDSKKNMKIDVSTFLNAVYSPVEIPIKTISLYKSELTSLGPRYTKLSEFSLNQIGEYK